MSHDETLIVTRAERDRIVQTAADIDRGIHPGDVIPAPPRAANPLAWIDAAAAPPDPAEGHDPGSHPGPVPPTPAQNPTAAPRRSTHTIRASRRFRRATLVLQLVALVVGALGASWALWQLFG